MATEATTKISEPVKQEDEIMGDLYPETLPGASSETNDAEEEQQDEQQGNPEDDAEETEDLPLSQIEQKYAGQAGTESETAAERESSAERELRLTKETLDNMLLCYCEMQELIESDKNEIVSFSETEAEAITDMAIDLLIRVFPKLVDRQSDEVTKTRALNYLKIYYQIHKLKQTERRRQVFLDKFIAIIRLGEMEDFFVETSVQFNQAIQSTCRELDERVNPKRVTPPLKRRRASSHL
jgi:hypothetical protein